MRPGLPGLSGPAAVRRDRAPDPENAKFLLRVQAAMLRQKAQYVQKLHQHVQNQVRYQRQHVNCLRSKTIHNYRLSLYKLFPKAQG